MFRINVYISDPDIDFLRRKVESTISEHVRRALDDYIKKLKNTNAAISLSEFSKGGKNNG